MSDYRHILNFLLCLAVIKAEENGGRRVFKNGNRTINFLRSHFFGLVQIFGDTFHAELVRLASSEQVRFLPIFEFVYFLHIPDHNSLLLEQSAALIVQISLDGEGRPEVRRGDGRLRIVIDTF